MKKLVLFLALLLAGCASTQKINYNEIDSVRVDPNVTVTTNPKLFGGWDTFFTVLTQVQRDKNAGYKSQLASDGIDVGEIVRDEFTAVVAETPKFKSKISDNGKYYFVLDVPTHAMVQKNTLSELYKPTIQIAVKLFNPKGELIFSDTESSCIFSDCITMRTLDEVKGNPQLLADQYRQASRDAIRQVLEKM